jgi:hypothetical protein
MHLNTLNLKTFSIIYFIKLIQLKKHYISGTRSAPISRLPSRPQCQCIIINTYWSKISVYNMIWGQFKTMRDFRLPQWSTWIHIILHYYLGSSGNFLPMLWDNLSVPSLGFKNSKVLFNSWTMKMEPIGCPQMSVRITTSSCLITQKSTVLSLKTKLMPISLEIWCTTFIMGHCIYIFLH